MHVVVLSFVSQLGARCHSMVPGDSCAKGAQNYPTRAHPGSNPHCSELHTVCSAYIHEHRVVSLIS